MDEKELAEKVMQATEQKVEALPKRIKVTIAILAMVLFCLVGYIAYEHFFAKSQPVTYEGQQRAETSEGVKEAANNAHIDMLQSQLEEAAKQIALLKNKAPDTITHTVVQQVPVVVEKERQKSGADFAIVTNPSSPNEKVDLSQYKATDPVVLNQYNVHAYKKILRQIDYAPQNVDDWTPKEIGYSVSRKISNDGKYLGVAVDHDFDDKKTTVKLRYTY
jgi:Tfp pilus assembly protein PilO